MREEYIMTYDELCRMILTLCNTLFDNVMQDEESNSMTLGGDFKGLYKLNVTIEKEDIR